MNHQEARDAVGRLLAAWPKSDMPPETLTIWIDLVCEYAAEDVTVAVSSLIRGETWFPTIARFREELAKVRREVQHKWTCHPDCPLCGGTSLQVDEHGRDWLCPDAVWTTVRAAIVPGAGSATDHTKFLAAARGLLPAMKRPR